MALYYFGNLVNNSVQKAENIKACNMAGSLSLPELNKYRLLIIMWKWIIIAKAECPSLESELTVFREKYSSEICPRLG